MVSVEQYMDKSDELTSMTARKILILVVKSLNTALMILVWAWLAERLSHASISAYSALMLEEFI